MIAISALLAAWLCVACFHAADPSRVSLPFSGRRRRWKWGARALACLWLVVAFALWRQHQPSPADAWLVISTAVCAFAGLFIVVRPLWPTATWRASLGAAVAFFITLGVSRW